MFSKVLIVTAALSLAAIMPSQANNERGEKRLKKLLSRHIFVSRSIGRDVRAAAGDPSMAIFDNRVERGQFAQCNFITYRGKRALTCNSI